MPYLPISQDLAGAIAVLKTFSPYPGHPERKAWDEAIDSVLDVEAQLGLIEWYRPALLDQLARDAYDEQQIATRPMIKEVRELLSRYARSR